MPAKEAVEPIHEPIEPILATLDCVSMKIEAARSLIYKINAKLFGYGEPEKDIPQPKCARDVLQLYSARLSELNAELEKLLQMLGV
jgi:hypothetical protein